MAVVRVDDKILRELKRLLDTEENKYKYASVSAFVNYALYEKLSGMNGSGSGKKRNKK